MKRFIVIAVAILLTVAMFTACGAPKNNTPSASAPASQSAAASGYEVAMITDIGNIDDKSFNQGTWEGVKKFADDNGKTNKYYKPTEKTTDAYVAAIDLAIKGGAKVVVTPGFLFEPAIYKAQDLYPDTKFILLDGNPNDGDYSKANGPTYKINKNVYSIFYAEQQSGFLAGYAAVKDGYTKLGFLGGMAVPAVIRYGYGFVWGCDVAAQELGLAAGSIEIKYAYTGNFDATPENQTKAASWYTSGTQVIFACGGKVGNSVMAAAEANKGKVIGVDVDQSAESATVITSAKKELAISVQQALKDYYAGSFKGGVSETLDITKNAVGLPIDTSKFTKFTKDDYKKIFDALVNDTNGIRKAIPDDKTADSADKLTLKDVKVTVLK